jgi:hypothetical protein
MKKRRKVYIDFVNPKIGDFGLWRSENELTRHVHLVGFFNNCEGKQF